MNIFDESTALQYIRQTFCMLVKSAIHETIDERKYWGVGLNDQFPNMHKLSESSSKKYFVEILSCSHAEGETDWTLVCRAGGRVADIYQNINVDKIFEVQVESSEEISDIFFDKRKLSIHNCYLDVEQKINRSEQLIEFSRKLQKALMFFTIAHGQSFD